MEEINNFKELEKEQIKLFESKDDKVKNSIDANMGGIRFFTEVFELYFSRIIDFFLNSSGGKNENNTQ